MLPLIGWSLLALTAAAEPRHALLISNTNHSYAANDARAMRARLEEFHFAVEVRENPKLEELRAAVAELGKQPGVILFYYSGKSADYGSEILLLAPDYKDGKPDLKTSYPVFDLVRTLEAGKATTRIAIMEGGFVKSGQKLFLTNLFGSPGTFAAFASAPGECGEAAWKGPNSLFTTKLLGALKAHSSLELPRLWRPLKQPLSRLCFQGWAVFVLLRRDFPSQIFQLWPSSLQGHSLYPRP